MNTQSTSRGFGKIEFKDRYGLDCRILKSSLATQDAIWFGAANVKAEVMAADAVRLGVKTTENTGWVDYPIPDGVLVHKEMHLTQSQVKCLLPILNYFAEHGELPPTYEPIVDDEET